MRLTNADRLFVKPGTPAPKKVKILSCSYPVGWYRDLIGETFEVDNASPPKDFVVWEDIVNNANSWRHIRQKDCEEIK